jgi:uncharacterized membrane protein YgcG
MSTSPFPKTVLLAIGFVAILAAHPLRADERILRFDSVVVVHKNSTMDVTETILVTAERQRIRHGIFRDFPTIYRDRSGRTHVVEFHVQEISCDGTRVPYHVEPQYNGVRIYIGDKDRFVLVGPHTYTLTYTTDRQLGFFADHDELYWNVTGNGWDFPIDRVEATVSLPGQVPLDQTQRSGYTGSEGSLEQALTASVGQDQALHFVASRPLGPHEGLTLVAEWPKGFVNPPTAWMRLGYFFRDNAGVGFVLLGIVAVLVYYGAVWWQVGKDPEGKTIIPLFTPPDGVSPAMMRYIEEMGYDDKVFAAALIHLAVQGVITIREESPLIPMLMKKTYVLEKKKEPHGLAAEEMALCSTLFGGRTTVTLGNSYDSKVAQAVAWVKANLKTVCDGNYFTTNSTYLAGGVIGSLGVIFTVFWLHDHLPIPPYALIVMFVGLLVINALFYTWLPAPTTKGREVMDKIEGFKMFLSATEADRLHLVNPAPELFETYLPYAMALGVEHQWGEQFAKAFAASSSGQQAPYSPSWYTGGSWNYFHPGSFASSMSSSVSHVIASAATAPGSSSGGGGGGSSGGGGGGGGGGGW